MTALNKALFQCRSIFLQNICQNRPDGIGSVSEVDERFVLGKTDGKLLFEDRIQKNIKY